MTQDEEYPDPFEKMANDLMEAGRKLVNETRNSRPTCPKCGERLWKRNDGEFSCPNPECDRGVIPAEEIATRKIINRFMGSL